MTFQKWWMFRSFCSDFVQCSGSVCAEVILPCWLYCTFTAQQFRSTMITITTTISNGSILIILCMPRFYTQRTYQTRMYVCIDGVLSGIFSRRMSLELSQRVSNTAQTWAAQFVWKAYSTSNAWLIADADTLCTKLAMQSWCGSKYKSIINSHSNVFNMCYKNIDTILAARARVRFAAH